ncbi:conserved hypothetical protein [Bacillus sp. 349Y]|nr:conserved hypothetical protein [Bacillus sp. 349Y]
MAGRIEGLTIDLGLDTIGIDSGLKSVKRKFSLLNSEMKANMSQFSRSEKSVEKYQVQLNGLNRKMDVSKVSVRNARQEYEKMVQQHGEGSKQADNAAKKYNDEAAALNNLERHIENVNKDMKALQDQQKLANNKWTKFGDQLTNTSDKLRSVGDSMRNIGRNMSLYVTAPIVGAGLLAGKLGIDFEESMSKVQAISRATGDDLEQLKDQARQLGADTQFSAREAAEGMQFLAMAGFDTKEILASMPGMLDLAAAGALDLGQAADITSNIMSGFSIAAEKSGHVADVLALAAASANTDVSQLGEAMKYLAAPANVMGWGIEESTAAVMAFSDAGIQGSMAGQAFASSLTRLASPTKRMDKILKNTGMEFFDLEGNIKPLPEVVRELEKALEGETAEMKTATLTKLFGAEAFKHWAVLMEKGSDALEDNTKKLIESEGASKKMAKTMVDNAAGDIKEFRSAMEELALQIYDYVQPALRDMIQGLTKFTRYLQGIPGPLQVAIALFAGLAASMGPILVVAGLMATGLSAILKPLGTLFKAFASFKSGVPGATKKIQLLVRVFTIFRTALGVLTGPVGWITLAVITLGTLIYKNWDVIKTKTIEVWGFVSKYLSQAWSFMKDVGIKTWSAVSGFFVGIWDNIKGAFIASINWIKGIWKKIMGSEMVTEFMKTFEYWKGIFQKGMADVSEKVSGALGWIKGVIKFQLAIITKVWSLAWGVFSSYVLPVLKKVKDALGTFFNAVKSVIVGLKPIFDAMKAVFITVFNAIVGVLKTNMGIIKSVVTQGFNVVKTIFSIVWNAIKTMFKVSWEFIKGTFSAAMMFLRGDTKGGMERIRSMITTVWNLIKKFFGDTWSKIKSIFTSTLIVLRNAILTYFNAMWRAIKTIMTSIWTAIKTIWTTILNTVKRIVTGLWSTVKNTFSSMKSGISNLAKGMKDGVINQWSRLKSGVTTLANALKDKVTGIFGKMVDAAKALPGKIKTGVINAKDKAVSGIKSLANSMMGKFGSLVNGLIGGVNTITGKLGIDKKIGKWEVPQYASGTGGHPGGAMIVGDKYGRELVKFPNGQTLLSPDTDTLVPNAPKGTQVIPNSLTEQILAGKVPMYKDGIGGAVKGLWNKGVDKFHQVKDTVKGWLGDVWDYASNPKKLVNLMIEKLGLAVSGLSGGAKSMAKAGFSFIKNKTVDFIKDKFATGGGGNVPMKFGNLIRTSGFGYRTHPITGAKHLHGGVDFAGPLGTAIKALVGGVVTSSGWNSGGYGNLVTIRNGIYDYYYAHLQKAIAKAGSAVKKGDIIGQLGSTGQSTGPHLHYEVRKNGQRINPGIGGFANGALIKKEQLAWVGEGNKEEVVIPTGDPSKRTAAMKLLALAAKKLGAGGGAGSSVSPNKLPNYGADNQVVQLLQQVIMMMQNNNGMPQTIVIQNHLDGQMIGEQVVDIAEAGIGRNSGNKQFFRGMRGG